MSVTSRRPSSTRPPSVRDLEIHRQVKVGCRRQSAVAKQFGLSKGQVSRIVQRVSAWRGGAPSAVQDELSPAAERRLGRWLARERAEEMYAEARRLMEEARQESGVGDRESEESRVGSAHHSAAGDGEQVGPAHATDRLRWAGVRLQAMKVATRAASEAYAISQEEPLPEPTPAVDDPHWRSQLARGLTALRQAAEAAGRVPRSPNVLQFVEAVMQILLGENPGVDCSGWGGPGSARWEVAARILRMAGDEAQFAAAYRAAAAGEGSAAEGGAQPRNLTGAGAATPAASAADGVSGDAAVGYDVPGDGQLAGAGAEIAREKHEESRASGHNSTYGPGTPAPPPHAPPPHAPAPDGLRQRRRQRQLASDARRWRAEIERQEELRQRRAEAAARRAYVPPLDLGYRPSVPDEECLADEVERRRQHLKSLVPVVTEG